MTENRLLGADFVRAAACITVLLHHLAQRMGRRDDLAFMEWMRPFSHIGTFGVAMFFVLSGFLLARPFWQALDQGEPMPALGTYGLRRAARILPGFWLALVVTFVLSIAVFEVPLDFELALRFVAGLLLVADWHWLTFFPVEINGPLWSIGFEVTSYVLLPLGFALLFLVAPLAGGGWRQRATWLGVIGLALVAHWLFVQLYPIDGARRGWNYGMVGGAKLWMPRYNPLGFFAMFAIGALAAGVQVRWSRMRHWVFDAIGVAGMAAMVWLCVRHMGVRDDSGYGWLGIPYDFPWVVLAVGTVLAATPSSRLLGHVLDNAVTRYVAQISFGIYIWHYLVLELVSRFWSDKFGLWEATDAVEFGVTCAVITGITAVVAHFSFHLVESPAIRWARRRERKGAAGPTLSPSAG